MPPHLVPVLDRKRPAPFQYVLFPVEETLPLFVNTRHSLTVGPVNPVPELSTFREGGYGDVARDAPHTRVVLVPSCSIDCALIGVCVSRTFTFRQVLSQSDGAKLRSGTCVAAIT